MKKCFLSMASCALIILFAAPALLSQDAPQGDIVMTVPEGAEATKNPVTFPHGKHIEITECATCHHTWDGAAPVQKCKNTGCHVDMATSKGEGSYKGAFHAKVDFSCKGCHTTLKKAGEKYGPTKCTQCHPKK